MISSVSFDVGGPRWRVYSKKLLDAKTIGQWTVVVTDENGWPLAVRKFIHGDKVMLDYLAANSQTVVVPAEPAVAPAEPAVAPANPNMAEPVEQSDAATAQDPTN